MPPKPFTVKELEELSYRARELARTTHDGLSKPTRPGSDLLLDFAHVADKLAIGVAIVALREKEAKAHKTQYAPQLPPAKPKAPRARA